MKPILFNTEMIRAILDGRKSMTRRPVTSKYFHQWDGMFSDEYIKDPENFATNLAKYQPGDVLWVRETWASLIGYNLEQKYWYKADMENPSGHYKTQWRSSIHMPREAARLFLRVTDVRVERLQDISTSDCEQEGIIPDIDRFNGQMTPHHDWITGEYARMWDSVYAKRGFGWNMNPFCWVYTFVIAEKEN